MTDPQASVVLVSRRGRVGQIELNRPKVINALNAEMVKIVTDTLEMWAFDADVRTVVLTGAGERGLCAGGDIVTIYEDAASSEERPLGEERLSSEEFWRQEYRLNALIARYPKPFVALQTGVVLGGGIGISAHGSVRIVTESSKLGMPETTIGFVPDVGGTYLLSRAPGQLGMHLALTAGTVGAADAILVGLADHFVAASRLPDFLVALESDPVEEVVSRFASPPPAGVLARARPWIDEAYSAKSVQLIVDRLQAVDDDGARAARTAIAGKSPTALVATLASVRSAALLPDLETVLEQEYRVTLRMLLEADLAEGIRAQVIDKDRNPHWVPASLDAVDDAHISTLFAPLGSRELQLERPGARSKGTE